jgi:hypothetical protein
MLPANTAKQNLLELIINLVLFGDKKYSPRNLQICGLVCFSSEENFAVRVH